MKIVLDTNVLLSANYAQGVCDDVFDAIIDSELHILVASEFILAEFTRHATSKLRATSANAEEFVKAIREYAEMVEPAEVQREARIDPDDLPVLGTALAGHAAVLVTGDKGLLKLARWQDIDIVSPRTMLERLRAEP